MKIVAIVQARMSSSRLPAKVLRLFNGKPAIIHLLERAARTATIDSVVLATSDHRSDDPLANVARDYGVAVYRGDLDDVLGRYYHAAIATNAEVIIRLTGDCPIHDPDVIAAAVEAFSGATDVDYLSNAVDRSYPDGLDVEVFSFEALEAAHRGASSAFDREHVTPWIHRHNRCQAFIQPVDLSILRWTLDYQEDAQFLSSVFSAFTDRPTFGSNDIYRWLREDPTRLHLADRQTPDAATTALLVERLDSLLQESR